VLRVETTINNVQPFQVYRPSETDPEGQSAWRCLQRGVADLWRRAEISRAANNRYFGALASITGKTALAQEARPVCRARIVDGQRYRALNPWSPSDEALLEAITRQLALLRAHGVLKKATGTHRGSSPTMAAGSSPPCSPHNRPMSINSRKWPHDRHI
jgi:hypothetical protein